ncbi:Lrp/AsnC family transcriptional regulator [Microbacterium ulmi]|uniref:Lrp/AsnC family transcriptional regulator n=1 Tax=Microbacterium ulmi TaxID=179095 RepID=A0A7Y2LYD2_9MICO|nr:Lrp/AsnC family transcriptional regulator [Microbacterium ulmi]NII68359.1 DNA-binding Lrp family transcriptional regulator [Microbacterium ulmi]NNH03106.1 Lrp/AsnC family transcriptional regulator [Microbacterium ulmi]
MTVQGESSAEARTIHRARPEHRSATPGAALDEIDLRLVELLQANSRAANNALADAVGIAPSTCLQRIRRLRETGVITRFTVDVDRRVLGLGLQALIGVRIRAGARHEMSAFMTALATLPGVVQTFFLGGDEDFLVHVAVRDSDAVRDFVLEHLSSHPAVAGTRTSLVLDHSRTAAALA